MNSETMNSADPEPRDASPARRRVLDTAIRLFYGEGVHAVGIDRIIAEADVAKATFYNHFPSKDDLVRAYIEAQDRLGRAAVDRLPQQPPRQMILAIFDQIGETARQPGYRGCPYINAAAEYPDGDHPVRHAIDAHRDWFIQRLRDLLATDGHPSPAVTADILAALWDGLLVGSHIGGLVDVTALARDAVARVLDGSVPAPTKRAPTGPL